MPSDIAGIITLPPSATADQKRLATNARHGMYAARREGKQKGLNSHYDKLVALVAELPGAVLGPRPILPAADVPAPVPAPVPVPAQGDLLDLTLPPSERVVLQEDIRVAINKAEKRLAVAKDIISLGDTMPSEVRAWAIKHITCVS
jgi:hypothetical protein